MRYGASRRLFGAPFCSPWSSRVRAVVAHDDDALPVTAGGQNGHVGNKHFIDQAERYATGNLRPVYFYRNQLQGHIEREYRPGSSFLTVAGSHGPVLPAPRGDTSGNRAPTRVSAATGRAPCAPGCRAPHRAPPRSSRGSHSRRARSPRPCRTVASADGPLWHVVHAIVFSVYWVGVALPTWIVVVAARFSASPPNSRRAFTAATYEPGRASAGISR